MKVNGTAQKAIEANNDYRLESQDESSTPDPWMDEAKPQLTLRQMLTQKLGERNLKGFVKDLPPGFESPS